MAVDISKWPLLLLMEHFSAWVEAARSEAFWHPEAEFRMWADRLRAEAKELVVWLEVKGWDEAASQLEERVSAFRDAMWEFEEASRFTFPPEDTRCRELADELIHRAEMVAAVCEDLDQEVPQEVWEGFLDG